MSLPLSSASHLLTSKTRRKTSWTKTKLVDILEKTNRWGSEQTAEADSVAVEVMDSDEMRVLDRSVTAEKVDDVGSPELAWSSSSESFHVVSSPTKKQRNSTNQHLQHFSQFGLPSFYNIIFNKANVSLLSLLRLAFLLLVYIFIFFYIKKNFDPFVIWWLFIC